MRLVRGDGGLGRSDDADGGEGGFEFCVFGGGHGDHGEAEIAVSEAHVFEGGFDGDRVGVEFEEGAEERVVSAVDGACGLVVVLEGGVDEIAHLAGDDIGGDADDAHGSDGHEGEGEGVVAAEGGEGIGAGGDELIDAFDAAAGFLHGDDVRAGGGETCGGVDADFDAAAAGDAVEDDAAGGGVGDGFEVLEETFLGGFVVVGADLEDGFAAGGFCGFGEFDGFVGAVAAGAADDGAAAVGEFGGEGDDVLVFLVGEGWGFAGGADWDDAGDAVIELEVDEFAEGEFVDLVIGGERGDEGCEGAAVHGGSVRCEGGERDQTGVAMVPAKTMTAGPVRVTSRNETPSRVKPTSRVSPPLTRTLTGEGAPESVAWMRAEATMPVPQARVSSSTPRS